MNWDPYDMPRSPDDPEDKGDRWPPPAGTPANVRTVLLVFAAMVLLALTFSTAANAQQGGSEQQEAQTQEEKAQDSDAQNQETQAQGTQAQGTQEQPTEEPKAEAKQESAQTGADSAEQAEAATPLEGQFVEQPEDTYAASDLIGRSVYSLADEEIGPISDLLVTKSNRIVGVVIGVGGFLGIGEKPVAVKMDRLQRGTSAEGDEQLVLNFTRQELEQAPAFVSLEEKREAQARQQQQEAQQQQAQQQEAQQQDAQQQDSGTASGNATQN